MPSIHPLLTAFALSCCAAWHLSAAPQSTEKEKALQEATHLNQVAEQSTISGMGGAGYRTQVGEGADSIPVVVVSGSPYEMGYHIGRLMKAEATAMIETFLTALKPNEADLDRAWFESSPFNDDRYEQEMLGLAAGSGIDHKKLRYAHVAPMLVPYSCSSVAAWGKATKDGKLYQSRALDWHLGLQVQNYPSIILYLPKQGIPHCNIGFAGMVGCHTGINAEGLVLTSMGNSPKGEIPYCLRGAYFLTFFRSMLYDAASIEDALAILQALPRIKRYHYVFGDGIGKRCGVKIKAHAPETPPADLIIWRDNDPNDEFAPEVLEDVVYNDEGRGAYPLLKKDYGALDAEKILEIAKAISSRNSNVMDVVYNASDLECWVAFAEGHEDAAKRDFVHVPLLHFDRDQDGAPDLVEGAEDADGDGTPNYLDSDTQ